MILSLLENIGLDRIDPLRDSAASPKVRFVASIMSLILLLLTTPSVDEKPNADGLLKVKVYSGG
jgi:hypothetical protein